MIIAIILAIIIAVPVIWCFAGVKAAGYGDMVLRKTSKGL